MNPLNPTADRRAVTALSVNVNKVALLRNTRHLAIPSVVDAARLCLRAGAHGITVHPRPDQRHIRRADVFDVARLLQAEAPHAEYNIEGNPFQNLMPLLRELHAQGLPANQCTFVPDGEGQFTSDHGWDPAADGERLRPVVAEAHALGLRVSLFMDADPGAMAAVREIGADRIELYTEPYAAAHASVRQTDVLARFASAAAAAQAHGLGVNAGHDLSQVNLTDFLRAVPCVLEVSIGHALIADALALGLPETVRAYLRCIHAGLHEAGRAAA